MIATVLITLLVTGVVLFCLAIVLWTTIGEHNEAVNNGSWALGFVSLVLIVIPGLLLIGTVLV